MVRSPLRVTLVAALGVALSPGRRIEMQQASPQRLQLVIERSTLHIGETTALRVEFLDRAYHVVPNDQNRVVAFELLPSDPGPTGVGVISPASLTVPRGASGATATLQARGLGRLFIQATSPGLVPARALAIIAPQPALLPTPSLRLAAYVQNDVIELTPHDAQRIPANGTSRAQLWVLLHRVLRPGERLHVLVQSFPGVTVRYAGADRKGVAEVVIDEQRALSDGIEISSSVRGTVHVVANILPNGPRDAVDVEFDRPRPTRVLFDRKWDTIPASQQEVPLTLRLVDQDRIPVEALERSWRIGLSSPTDPDLATFDPDTVELQPARAVGHAVLRLASAPASKDVKVLAKEVGAVLEPDESTLTLVGWKSETSGIIILVAGLGGALGGLARDVYRRQTHQILPHWAAGYIHLGLVGNVLFSFLFGYVLYQAAAFGFVALSTQASALIGTRTAAFFFGVLGGIGGIAVLDRLLDRVFPGRKTGERPRVVAH